MLLQNITQQQIQQLRQTFALFDKDSDGSINNKELKTVLRSLGHNPTKQQLDSFITLIDQDRSGSIDFRQFLLLISRKLNQKTFFDQIIQAFQFFDKNNNNYLSRIQFKLMIQNDPNLNARQLQQIFQQLDTNQQGVIDITQYVTLMLKSRNNTNQN